MELFNKVDASIITQNNSKYTMNLFGFIVKKFMIGIVEWKRRKNFCLNRDFMRTCFLLLSWLFVCLFLIVLLNQS
ncbi:MAG: hypothetical protein DKM50_02710 [Candidatus Margulisiibacteriota bacterium]|nr:MAG: hypothetical protein A2X43_03515 [Candidatus Margulisbacteria bacterium GWD2_39_127]OGI05391.1 MAG: hypothetical protein A2X42_13180 [Candidatus Margulisbacteria bacterium GWF2_38_17]OGI11010.1 MAG: hypothetical protein A2X41_02055 [Candidatus Margulisbacteria bacterium GWE2_39_32]PZM83204.1 MAG: hypothetical protein DKM50_02710 [Candidatus Margulisiibacteriota bacterium]HAR62491.1 hypothetical protein [Candidatus Margulisiibacteriota bacterium]